MKSPEPEPVELSDYTPFVDRADVKDTLDTIEKSLGTLNHGLAHPALNGSTLFGIKTEENVDTPPTIAGAIASVNVGGIESYRLNFNENVLQKRKLLIAGAAFKECIVEEKPVSRFSIMNSEEDYTFSYPIFNEDSSSVIGVVEHAYHYPGNMLPEDHELMRLRDSHQSVIDQISRSLQWLFEADPDPLTALELAPAILSNHFAIRWDIANAYLLRETNYGAFMAYLIECKRIVREIVAKHCPTAVLASIDDQNVIIAFPKYLADDPNDITGMKVFQNREIAKLSSQIEYALSVLAEARINTFIPNLLPQTKVSYGNGFFEKDDEGKLQSPLLYTMQHKNLIN